MSGCEGKERSGHVVLAAQRGVYGKRRPTALEQAGIGFECIVRSGRNYTGADRRMTNAHSADAGIWYVYVRSADLEAAEGVAQRALRGG